MIKFHAIITSFFFLWLFNSVYPTRKNLLIITVDDLKPTLGYYQDKSAKTPHIDALARRSTAFLKNYCQQAVCAPSRVSMMTGMRPDSTGVQDLHTFMRDINPKTITLPQHLKNQGYRSIGYGKILHGAKNDDPESWDERYLDQHLNYSENHPNPVIFKFQNPKIHKKYNEYIQNSVFKPYQIGKIQKKLKVEELYPATESFELPDDAYPDGSMANASILRLSKLAKEQEPFIMTLGFRKPHLPFNAPKKYWDIYNRNDFTLSPSQTQPLGAPKIAMHSFGELGAYSGFKTGENVPEAKQKELIHGYYACVSYVDAQIGKVMEAMDYSGLSKNTVIIFWGDHGYHLGDHGIWCKHSNFEQATATPLLIMDPTIKPDQKVHHPTELVDIFPSVCELLNLPRPNGIQGDSLVPLMKDPSTKIKNYAMSQYTRHSHQGYSIRTKRYRLTYWMKKGFYSFIPFKKDLLDYVELYDYQTDPHEKINHAKNMEFKEVLERMETHMQHYFKKYEDPHLASTMPNLIADKSRKFKK